MDSLSKVIMKADMSIDRNRYTDIIQDTQLIKHSIHPEDMGIKLSPSGAANMVVVVSRVSSVNASEVSCAGTE